MEMRKYITDNGYEMMLPDTDERVMTIDELFAAAGVDKNKGKKSAVNTPCPHCRTYCYGDCQS
mgnify:CR=1 FL=1